MSNDKKTFSYAGEVLSPGMALDITRGKVRGVITPETAKKIAASKGYVEEIVNSERTVYGINTGFGPLCSEKISPEDTKTLQYNILKSHSSGVGEYVGDEVAKLMMVLKVHALAQGFSGIAPATIERIVWHIDNDVVPLVPAQGSVGASGDLAPLSHLFLPLIGLGLVKYKGETVPAGEVLKKEGLEPVALGPKEGLALINGTQFMAAHGVIALERFLNCLNAADLIGAMSIEALLGSNRPFIPELHSIRPYKGTKHVAARLLAILKDSELVDSHKNCSRVQDPYSLRCMPQVHGASRNAWLHLKEILETEINSVTDNPIILDAENTISGGNFHGQPIAVPMDYATVAVSELGNISDRRSYLLLEGNEGLPKFLIADSGLNSGFMIPQYTSAALVTENKTLCFPASADSIPTSLGQEDHVSMGSVGSRKLNRVISNLENILAVELLSAAQGFDFRRPLKSSPVIEACHAALRKEVSFVETDRILGDDLVKAADFIREGVLVDTALAAAEEAGVNINKPTETDFGMY